MSRTEQVRRALKELGEATIKDLGSHLGVRTHQEINQIAYAVNGLQHSGEVTAIKLGADGKMIPPGKPVKYRWVVRITTPRGDKQGKLWSAMQIKAERGEVWRVADVAMLAGANLDYAKRYVRYCFNQHRVDQVHRMLHTPGNPTWYRLAPGQESREAPAWNRRAETAKNWGQEAFTASPQKNPKEILREMRQTLTAISGGAELVLGLVDELEAALGIAPVAGEIKETGHAGPDLDES